MRAIFLGAILCLALACTKSVSPFEGRLLVGADPPELRLTNHSRAAVYTIIIERGSLALADWGPCVDPSRCEALPSGASTTVPYSEIWGYTPAAREAVVYWWHLVPDGSGFRPDEIRNIVVEL